jgi:hypothetical protein
MTRDDARKLAKDTRVFCTVTAQQCWYVVEAVRPRDGYLKLYGVRVFCPPHNFNLTGPR